MREGRHQQLQAPWHSGIPYEGRAFQAIDELLADKMDVISEREAYLRRELQRMWLDEDLLGMPKDTVIVAARRAWHEYQDVHACICQPDRAFQPVRHLGFYADGRILPLVPRILERRYPGPLGRVVKALLARGRAGEEQKCSSCRPRPPRRLSRGLRRFPTICDRAVGAPWPSRKARPTSVSRTWNVRYSRRR